MSVNDSDSLAAFFIGQLEGLAKQTFRHEKPTDLALVDAFMRHFLGVFVREDFRPSREKLLRFIFLNEVIANLTAVSVLQHTDTQIAALRSHAESSDDLCKLLALYSPRNAEQLDPAAFFAVDTEAASLWYCRYIGSADWACLSQPLWQRLQHRLAWRDERLGFAPILDHVYFAATYIDADCVAAVRSQIHTIMRRLGPPLPPVTGTGRRRIALVTGRWYGDNVVHRALAPFIKALALATPLTLIQLGQQREGADLQDFAEVLPYCFEADRPEAAAALAGRFDMLLFADIGLNMETLQLTSLRLAPIQVALCGHPDSSWSPDVDYFIHGADVIDPALAAQQFGERLVLIPGCGQANTRPGRAASQLQPPEDSVRIACCWSSQKIHHEHLQRLLAACEGVQQPVRFVFFGIPANGFLPIVRGLKAALGEERVEAVAWLSYENYLAELGRCHFSVDSFPFGGYITVADLLWQRKPVVALSGTHSYSRNAAYFQSRLGLSDMTTVSEADFIRLLRRMIVDAAYRAEVIARLQAAPVEDVLLSDAAIPHFVAAIGLLLDQHTALKQQATRAPIMVNAA